MVGHPFMIALYSSWRVHFWMAYPLNSFYPYLGYRRLLTHPLPFRQCSPIVKKYFWLRKDNRAPKWFKQIPTFLMDYYSFSRLVLGSVCFCSKHWTCDFHPWSLCVYFKDWYLWLFTYSLSETIHGANGFYINVIYNYPFTSLLYRTEIVIIKYNSSSSRVTATWSLFISIIINNEKFID